MKTPLEIDADGNARHLQKPGMGVDLDWTFIDKHAVRML